MDIQSITDMANYYRTNASTSRITDDTVSFKSYLESASAKEDAELRDACLEFESYFINLMFKELRNSVGSSNSLIPKSNAQQIFEDMFYDEMSKNAAKQNGIGLATFMYNQLKMEQEAKVNKFF